MASARRRAQAQESFQSGRPDPAYLYKLAVTQLVHLKASEASIDAMWKALTCGAYPYPCWAAYPYICCWEAISCLIPRLCRVFSVQMQGIMAN